MRTILNSFQQFNALRLNDSSSCSGQDSYIHVWDRRETRRPTHSLHAASGVTQVCWERVSGNVLASSHDGDVRLWDVRASSAPAGYISAHADPILALDFSVSRRGYLASSGADSRVKFWDVERLGTAPEAERQFQVPQAPVWKMRYTPFGEGLVTLSLNYLSKGENALRVSFTVRVSSAIV